jgi:hypothetical protein
MPDVELSDEEFKKAEEHVTRTVDILDMELQTSGIPVGMFLVGMSRFIGHAIRKATSALGPEKREEQLEAFFKIISNSAKAGEHGDIEEEE